jgi:hypothetical protein
MPTGNSSERVMIAMRMPPLVACGQKSGHCFG